MARRSQRSSTRVRKSGTWIKTILVTARFHDVVNVCEVVLRDSESGIRLSPPYRVRTRYVDEMLHGVMRQSGSTNGRNVHEEKRRLGQKK